MRCSSYSLILSYYEKKLQSCYHGWLCLSLGFSAVVLFGRSWSGVGEEKRNSGPILSYKYDTNPLLLMLFVSSLVAFIWRPHFPGAVFSKIE